MPYIITKRELDETSGLPGPPVTAPEAAAELFDARDIAAHLIEVFVGGDPDWEEVYTDAQGCPEEGGTFGPLQDGRTVIEVERVLIETLIRRGNLTARYLTAARFDKTAMSDADVIAAYNAANQKGE